MKTLSNLLLTTVPFFAFAAGCQDQPSPDHEDDKKVDVRRIPLGSIYSTNRQKGLKAVAQGHEEAYDPYLKELNQRWPGMGASNIFLASGEDITAAVKATWEVLTAGHAVDKPVGSDPSTKADQYWLVVYFGVAPSNPPEWLVGSVEMKGKNVRMTFAKGVGELRTHNKRQYYVWVPLGSLQDGTYTLELFDEDRQEIELSRRVTIPKK